LDSLYYTVTATTQLAFIPILTKLLLWYNSKNQLRLVESFDRREDESCSVMMIGVTNHCGMSHQGLSFSFPCKETNGPSEDFFPNTRTHPRTTTRQYNREEILTFNGNELCQIYPS
jgi:hypothetical protein